MDGKGRGEGLGTDAGMHSLTMADFIGILCHLVTNLSLLNVHISILCETETKQIFLSHQTENWKL